MKYLIGLLLLSQSFCNEVKVLYTSTLLSKHFEVRKNEYIKSLLLLDQYGFRPKTYVVESTGRLGFTFLEPHCDHILYANVQDLKYKNKGVKEALAMRAAFNFFNFDDDDMIIKLTGRYYFKNDDFLQLVLAHPEVDVFASYLGCPTRPQTGCFAMKGKYFRRMLNELDIAKMEAGPVDIECTLGDFIKKMLQENANVQNVDRMGIIANVDHKVVAEL